MTRRSEKLHQAWQLIKEALEVWVIGTLVAVELLLRGWAWVIFALAARG